MLAHNSPSSPSAKTKIGLQRNGDQVVHGAAGGTSMTQSPMKQPRSFWTGEYNGSPNKQVVDKTQILGRPVEIIKSKLSANKIYSIIYNNWSFID